MNEIGISFVVPTRNSGRTIEACLRSVRAQRRPDIEVVVVDNWSSDGTFNIAVELADRAIRGGPERSAQRNLGASLARGLLLGFIDSDMVLSDTVAGEAIELLSASDVAAAVIPELAFGQGYLARCRGLEKRLYLGGNNVEAARLFRRDIFDRFGGYDTSLTGPEDWQLPDRIRRAGLAISRIESVVWHDEGRVSLRDTFRKKRYYGRSIAAYVSGHRSSARSKFMRTLPAQNLRTLFDDPFHAPGLALLKTVDVGGIAVGMLDSRRSRSG